MARRKRRVCRRSRRHRQRPGAHRAGIPRYYGAFAAWGLRNYLSSAMRKLGVHSRRDAVDLAKEKGWL
jgi:hypothetical protein